MISLSSQQVKAARALLGWTQEDLADASCLSLTSIRSFEVGYIPRYSTMNAICKAVENAGIEFTENDGVRRATAEIKLFRGASACDDFFKRVLETSKTSDADHVCIFVRDVKVLTQHCGFPPRSNLQRLEKVCTAIECKCLLLHGPAPVVTFRGLDLRMSTSELIGPLCVIMYGNRYGYFFREKLFKGEQQFMILEFNILSAAREYRAQFLSAWESAKPVVAKDKARTAF
ncbi:MAG: helix-turn-helix domain-containing protein [Alphaproteobacteria bacterium]|nr:helix-turn-helix domain-containing protein [Alphaproteobacteria bacterium]